MDAATRVTEIRNGEKGSEIRKLLNKERPQTVTCARFSNGES